MVYPVLEQARKGDPEATCALVESLRPRMSSMAAYYARCSGEDADDLLQEAWMGVLEALPSIDVTIGSPEQYLIRHARWQLLDAIRRARTRRPLQLDEFSVEVTTLYFRPATDSAFVSEFIKHLTETQRTILRYLMAGFTWREVGRMLGCTSANVAYYVRQIRRQYEKWNTEQV